MKRREILKGFGGAAVASGVAATATAQGAEAKATSGPVMGPYAEPWDPVDPDTPSRRDIAPMPDDYYSPGRFNGKTVIVTGCARGMGAGAAWRLAREGANIVGVDWLEDEGKATMSAIAGAGHKVRFLAGDVSDDAVCAQMVELAVSAFGGVDAALNNAGVMDGVHSREPADYAAQKDLTSPSRSA